MLRRVRICIQLLLSLPSRIVFFRRPELSELIAGASFPTTADLARRTAAFGRPFASPTLRGDEQLHRACRRRKCLCEGGVRVARQGRVVADLVDVRDACPLQPVAEERRLKVTSERGTELGPPDRARVDDRRRLPGKQGDVASLG